MNPITPGIAAETVTLCLAMSRGSSSEASKRLQASDRFQRWQDVKAQQRAEEHELLKQKLSLQHQLIDALDARTAQRQQELLQKQANERDARKKEEKERNKALVKNTLRKVSAGRRKTLTQSVPKDSIEPFEDDDEEVESDPDGLPDRERALSAIPSSERNVSAPSTPIMSASGDVPGYEQGTLQHIFSEEEVEGWDQLPPYKQELYKMFGARDAENYLEPKDMSEKKEDIHVPDALRALGGRAGADRLWDLLRSNTQTKMSQRDSQIPAELRRAYSSFIREYLAHTTPEERRRFYTEKDLPASERIEDSRHHEHVREIRRRMELMYRSSLANKDKTDILLYNNPMPDFSDLNGEVGVRRYQPSWVNDEEPEKESVDRVPPLKHSDDHDTKPEPSLDAQQKPRQHRSRRGQKLSFLTEEKATVEGQFWKNRRNPEEETTLSGRATMAHAAIGKGQDSHGERQDGTCKESGLSPKPGTNWQPLTYSALGDHKPVIELKGGGDFRFGQPTTWHPVNS